MIADCSKVSILQYFRPSLSYHLSLRSLVFLFLSDRFTQILLYSGVDAYSYKFVHHLSITYEQDWEDKVHN